MIHFFEIWIDLSLPDNRCTKTALTSVLGLAEILTKVVGTTYQKMKKRKNTQTRLHTYMHVEIKCLKIYRKYMVLLTSI